VANGHRTFVGFGFGPIQIGLFLYEALLSNHFSRYVVVDVDAGLVNAIRNNGGAYQLNIARPGGIDVVSVGGVEVYHPGDPQHRRYFAEAVSEADEMATALPSVNFYDVGAASVAAIIGAGIAGRRNDNGAVIYAAENNNHAAEILTKSLAKYAPPQSLARVQAVNTVIGKMSGVITDADSIRKLGLATLTPDLPRAILVEEFNGILISRIHLDGFSRGIDVFIEKDDLLPFEEAKLYGHNAIHALIGYLADLRGLPTMAAAAGHPDIMAIARRAFLEESGPALIAKYGHLNDPLFTPTGYQAYADDLLTRMVQPNLNDLVSRVIRDHVRKLGYDDRLFGTMRLALRYGIEPKNLATGAAAAVISMVRQQDAARPIVFPLPHAAAALTEDSLRVLLANIWADKADEFAAELVRLTWQAYLAIIDRPVA
jgi:mannitol-1-phosphate 5-dehydrogenase